MDAFTQALAALDQRQAAPVREAKQRLAAARTALDLEWKAFRQEKPRLEGIFQEGKTKCTSAMAQGVSHGDLIRLLEQVFGDGYLPGLLQGIENNYKAAVGQIDGLSEPDLNFVNVLPSLSAAPTHLRDCVSQLESLAQRVPQYLKELEEKVKSAVPALMTTEPPPRRDPRGVVDHFEV